MILKIERPPTKNLVIASTVVVLVVILLVMSPWKSSSLVPPDIKKQLSFNAIYPGSSTDTQISPASFSYQPSQNSLAISLKYQGQSIILSEQKAPDSVLANTDAANQQLGVHPYAQFQSRLGLVSLTKLFQGKTYSAQGQLGVLVAKGTLILAHSATNLSTNQWEGFFNNLF